MLKHAFAFVMGLTLSVGLIGCGPQKTSDEDVQVLTINDYDELRAGKRNVVLLVDVRPKRDYEAGYLPGAVNVPLPEIVSNMPQLGSATHLVAYSQGGIEDTGLGRAGAKKLIAFGYKNVYELRGGAAAWEAEGRKLVK